MLENNITITFDKKHYIDYEKKIFNGGELNVKLLVCEGIIDDLRELYQENDEHDIVRPLSNHEITVEADLKNPYGIVELSLLKNGLDNFVHFWGINVKYILVLNYLPYARQDRVCNEGEAFSLKVFAQQLNSLKFDEIHVCDAHSNVSLALIDNVMNFGQSLLFSSFLSKLDKEKTVLVSPDSGSRTKTFECGKNWKIPVIRAEKMRNPLTGEITGSILVESIPKGVETVVILDDICEYGGTFKALAQEIRKTFSGKIVLMVTHSTLPYENHPVKEFVDEFIVYNQF